MTRLANETYEQWIVEYGDLVERATARDEAAWQLLVDRLSGVVWKVLNSFGLDPVDRDEAYSSTFYRLFNKLDTIREPSLLPGWIATTARNEARAVWRAQKRHTLMEELPFRDIAFGNIDDALLDNELLREVMGVFRKLPAQTQVLLRLLTTVPPLSYDEISLTLNIPKGSIGPTAGRALKHIRATLRPYTDGDCP